MGTGSAFFSLTSRLQDSQAVYKAFDLGAIDTEEKLTHMQCMPEGLKDRIYYHPTEEGEEKKTAERLKEIKKFREDK